MSCKNKQIISQALNSPYVIKTAVKVLYFLIPMKSCLVFTTQLSVATGLFTLLSAPARFLYKTEWLHSLFLCTAWDTGLHIYETQTESSKSVPTLISPLSFGNLDPILHSPLAILKIAFQLRMYMEAGRLHLLNTLAGYRCSVTLAWGYVPIKSIRRRKYCSWKGI